MKRSCYKLFAVLIIFSMTAAALCGCASRGQGHEKYRKYADMTAEEITVSLTLEQKANQMVMAPCFDLSPETMRANCFGSIFSIKDEMDYKGWKKMVDKYQQAAIESEAGIPYFFGNDQVHGAYKCTGAVVFPHNIGMCQALPR